MINLSVEVVSSHCEFNSEVTLDVEHKVFQMFASFGRTTPSEHMVNIDVEVPACKFC